MEHLDIQKNWLNFFQLIYFDLSNDRLVFFVGYGVGTRTGYFLTFIGKSCLSIH